MGLYMRVITGKARGRRLISPEGFDVRPTTDRVKECMFSIIQFELEGKTVLDLFAGTGQLGIEALSRGAAKAVFVDSSRKSAEIVKQNLALAKIDAVTSVTVSDAIGFLNTAREKFDIVILDPPYGKGLCDKAFEILPRVLNDNAVVICETSADETLPEAVGGLTQKKEYRYSAIKLTVYRGPTEEN